MNENINQNTTASTAESNQNQANQQQQTINNIANESIQSQAQRNNVSEERIIEMSRGMDADKLKALEPYLTSYIKKDVEEKAAKDTKIAELEKEISSLRMQLGRVNDITMIGEYGLETSEYDDINRLCDYNITPEKLKKIVEDRKYTYLVNKRNAQKIEKSEKNDDILFGDLFKETGWEEYKR